MVKASPLEYALIGLLKQQTRSGYDLRKEFANTPMRHHSDSPGSIYPALRRLQARGWVKWSSDEEGRKRQLCRVTAAGNRAFVEWLKVMPTRDDVIWRSEELMLRFAFQGGNVPHSITRHFLKELQAQLVAYVNELRQYAKQSGLARGRSTGALAFDCGVEGYEAQLAWTKRALRKFAENRS